MRSILNSEIKKETFNSAVFGAYNASVGDSPQYQKSLEDQLKDQSPKEVQDFIHQTAKNIRAYEDAIKSKDFSEERKASFKKLLDAENKRMDLVNDIHFPKSSKNTKRISLAKGKSLKDVQNAKANLQNLIKKTESAIIKTTENYNSPNLFYKEKQYYKELLSTYKLSLKIDKGQLKKIDKYLSQK